MATVTEVPGGDVREPGRRTPWLLIGGGALATAVVIGGGAYAATQLMGGGGDRPAAVLPGSAAAYMQVDLDPSAGEKVAAVRFFQGLDPEMRQRLTDGEWREWVWEQLEEEYGAAEDVDFATDIEPWLGDRAGVALLAPQDPETGEPVVAVALQVKDGDQALAFFDERVENDEEFAYYLESDYLVFSQTETLETVRSAAAAGTLVDDETFTSDMEDLGDQGIASFWVDAGQLDDVTAGALNPAMPMTGTAMDMEQTPQVEGRMAATVRLTPDAIELHGVTRGAEGMALATDNDAASLVDQLPADTAVALSLENGAAMVQSVWDFYAEQNPEELQRATEEAAQQGFVLPDDLKTVLGDSMAISVGPGIVDAFSSMSPTDSGVPALPLGYRVTTDTARLQELLNSNGVGAGVTVVRDDDGTLTVGTDQSYVDGLAEGSGATLGSSDLFTTAVPDADAAQSVLFVDVNPFEQYYLPEVTDENTRSALEKLGAVGISGTNESESDGRFTLRLVADPQ